MINLMSLNSKLDILEFRGSTMSDLLINDVNIMNRIYNNYESCIRIEIGMAARDTLFRSVWNLNREPVHLEWL